MLSLIRNAEEHSKGIYFTSIDGYDMCNKESASAKMKIRNYCCHFADLFL